jgi:hypothetical protein
VRLYRVAKDKESSYSELQPVRDFSAIRTENFNGGGGEGFQEY